MSKQDALTILDFENYGMLGLSPTSYFQGSVVKGSALVTDQYLDRGVLISGAALVECGTGHAASGKESLAGVAANGTLDYDKPITFTFEKVDGSVTHRSDNSHGHDPITNHYHDGTTDYFAFTPDKNGCSGNTITLSGYDINGKFLGSVTYNENADITKPLVLSGIGDMHKVVVDTSLHNVTWGGIAIDDVTFGTVKEAGKSIDELLNLNFGDRNSSTSHADTESHQTAQPQQHEVEASVALSASHGDFVSLVGLIPQHQVHLDY